MDIFHFFIFFMFPPFFLLFLLFCLLLLLSVPYFGLSAWLSICVSLFFFFFFFFLFFFFFFFFLFFFFFFFFFFFSSANPPPTIIFPVSRYWESRILDDGDATSSCDRHRDSHLPPHPQIWWVGKSPNRKATVHTGHQSTFCNRRPPIFPLSRYWESWILSGSLVSENFKKK